MARRLAHHAKRSISGNSSSRSALLAPQRHELGRVVCARVRRSRAFGEREGVTRKPLGLVKAAGQCGQYAPPRAPRRYSGCWRSAASSSSSPCRRRASSSSPSSARS